MKLFVGNLPYNTTETDLAEFFHDSGYQTSSVKILTNRETGQSRGFGFVEIADKSSAKDAIADLHGADYGGRPLVINEARPMEQRSGGNGGNRQKRD